MTFELTARCSASELLVHCGGSGRGRTYTPFGLDLQSSEPAKCSTLPYFYKDNTFFLIYQNFFVIPVRFELTTPPLKVECSKPTELRDLLFVILVTFHNTCFYLFILFSLSDRSRTCGLSVPNAPLYQTELHLVIIWRKPEVSIPIPVKVLPVFKTGLQAAAIRLPIYRCLGWTRTNTPGTKIRCPAIRLRDIIRPICQRTFSFCLRFLSGSN